MARHDPRRAALVGETVAAAEAAGARIYLPRLAELSG